MTLRILIADDEPLAIGRLSAMLEEFEGIELVGASDGGAKAISDVRRLQPDLVLVDVEMPQVDGFDVVEAIARDADGKLNHPPLIAFVTAYPQFAVEAFDTGALDFICKPVRRPRLEKLLKRARAALNARAATQRLADLRTNLKQLREATVHVEERHLWVRHRGELLRIRSADVEWVEAQACYVKLHLRGASYFVRNSIGSLAGALADDGFVRVHKSALVNRGKVVRVKSAGGRLSLLLEAGAEIPVGRKYRDAVRDIVEMLGR